MVADQPGRGAVQEIGAGRLYFPVRAGDLRLRLGPVRGAALAAGKPPPVAGKSLSPAGQRARVGDLLPVRGDREILDAQVDSGDRARGGKLVRDLNLG
jgi:hypothetical protein